MSMRKTWVTLGVMAGLASGCGLVNKVVTKYGSADGDAFAVDLAQYEVESVRLALASPVDHLCPGDAVGFQIVTTAHLRSQPSGVVELQSRPPDASPEDSRGKVDLSEFSVGARAGTIASAAFIANGNPFQGLLGYDLQAKVRRDESKVAVVHFDPEYSCIRAAGTSGAKGQSGMDGAYGNDGGGAGGGGGPAYAGGPGPRVTAHISLVRTPLYDRVGIVRISGDASQITLFDPAAGITIYARGGDGGQGGRGGDGGYGAFPEGYGGPGGSGGNGGDGGPGGEAVVWIDDRFPELAKVVTVDVSGGTAGSGGDGGWGGHGGDPQETCAECPSRAPGPDGAAGNGGLGGQYDGAAGSARVQLADVAAAFTELPPGVQLRDDPRPKAVAPPAPAGKPKHKAKHGRRR